MAKYGTFKYGTTKYGAYQNAVANVSANASMKKKPLKKLVSIVNTSTLFSKTPLKRIREYVYANISTNKTISKKLINIVDIKSLNKKRSFKILANTVNAGILMKKTSLKKIVIFAKSKLNISKSTNKAFTVIVSASTILSKSIFKRLQTLIKVIGKAISGWDVYPDLSYIEYSVNLKYSSDVLTLNYDDYIVSMEVKGVPIAGSTITLKVIFPDSAGNLTQLENVTAKVYAPGKVLLETIPANMISDGVYTAIYTIPEDKFGQFDYEFTGKLGNKTIVGRSSFDSVWK